MASAPRPTNRKKIAIGKGDHLYTMIQHFSPREPDLTGETGALSALLLRRVLRLETEKEGTWNPSLTAW